MVCAACVMADGNDGKSPPAHLLGVQIQRPRLPSTVSVQEKYRDIEMMNTILKKALSQQLPLTLKEALIFTPEEVAWKFGSYLWKLNIINACDFRG